MWLCLQYPTPTPILIKTMKHLYAIAIVIGTIAFLLFFDTIVVFLLSGFIPGINITLAPSTSIAVMIASTILIAAIVQFRHAVYMQCLAFYDAFLFKKKTSSNSVPKKEKAKLPKRRYQQL